MGKQLSDVMQRDTPGASELLNRDRGRKRVCACVLYARMRSRCMLNLFKKGSQKGEGVLTSPPSRAGVKIYLQGEWGEC